MPTSNALRRFAEASQREGLVVIAGAGVSAGEPARLPTWSGLVDRMAMHAERYSLSRAAAIREQMASDLLAAIDLWEIGDIIPPVERANFIKAQFATDETSITDAARAIGALDATLYLTTNYDSILNHAVKAKTLDAFSNSEEDLRAVLSNLGSRPLVLQLHGRALVYERMVLGSRSYERITNTEPYRQLLRQIFLRHCVLAVGFSFTDPPFRKLIAYIADQLGGGGAGPHLVIAAASAHMDRSLLRKANFEIVSYDDAAGHGDVPRLLRQLQPDSGPRSKRSSGTRAMSTPLSMELARIYETLTTNHKGQAFDLAAASLVAHGLSAQPQREPVLAVQLARRMALPVDVATSLVRRGATVLKQAGSLDDNKDVLRLRDWAPRGATDSSAIVEALNLRLRALDRRQGGSPVVRDAALDVVKRVMLVQGMTAARAFVEADPPDAYLLESVVAEAAQLACVPAAYLRVVTSAVTQVLRAPSPETSCELFKLAHAAFALESVFLNPAHPNLGSTLAWEVYLDSNILLRLLHPACDATGAFRRLVPRLRRLGVPLIVIRPFLEEVIGHADLIARQVQGLPASAIDPLLRATPVTEQSPLLRWYSFSLGSFPNQSFAQFRGRVGLGGVGPLIRAVERMEIRADTSDAVRDYDTADRETLWHDLRHFRNTDQSTQGARRLRRAEATQVLWLAKQRAEGTRAWFLSQDGQLRRALKYVANGRYAGYVTTPAAWMLRLAELHWGELDVAGFSELMWVIPLAKPTERLRAEVAEGVLRRAPDLGGEHPEWLRDRIEDALEKVEPLLKADFASLPDEEDETEALSRWSRQVVPTAVEEILDKLAKSQAAAARQVRGATSSSVKKARRR